MVADLDGCNLILGYMDGTPSLTPYQYLGRA
ncbi:hypothetical protein FOXG_19720 [Fusarium oxysporum f. sp. lycopersici 4287]|uniref:Uncharacterized protein n=1 Tax=Fusarium oxysporum f. sp. lycopersici (strain 4287 / CBS 123668 / FGSC 9935 / NRRL 34936) TaxID=426428 RepID=A0A0J9WLV9_FUSO4|nr:hypothetical protein FOXG_19306 [Fusarium oxysporum f. sp. lycopersici 4287]XP_018242688.1 hypothetical protein FOXG_19354 [Fusarium oxysporum f. sp. lycopersici 4287]XP_018244623.1 hypothetical protein FOXG_19720 [Fusarium oxysporum f. sp. lycopersici 4287]KNB04462.1 hypothetical protein FOXG_19306 [Fusarium oxysporum f. sp. lycopersici 4287]KNB04643.1 hypothetical protein FOXG_19354 [Fusarium oxysporum f. sp. lycopersici 4287]KNB06578.1 hypothetical protein FOXG_19720 [Fusarium oxysporum 